MTRSYNIYRSRKTPDAIKEATARPDDEDEILPQNEEPQETPPAPVQVDGGDDGDDDGDDDERDGSGEDPGGNNDDEGGESFIEGEELAEDFPPFPPLDPVGVPVSPPPSDFVDVAEGWQLEIRNWLTLWAVYLSSGAAAVTETQYEIVRNLFTTAFHSPLLHWRGPDEMFENLGNVFPPQNRSALPSYFTIWKYIRPTVLKRLAVRSKVLRVEVNRNAIEMIGNAPTAPVTATADVPVVLPSAYAIADISTAAVWRHFEEEDYASRVPVVRDRARFYDCRSSISVDSCWFSESHEMRARIGDVINVHITTRPSHVSALGPFISTSGNPRNKKSPPKDSLFVRARVLDVFGVKHYSRYQPNSVPDDVTSGSSHAFLQFCDFNASEDTGGKMITKPRLIFCSKAL